MAKTIVVSQPVYKWLNSQRRTIKGKYTAAKKESFDSVLERIMVQVDPSCKMEQEQEAGKK